MKYKNHRGITLIELVISLSIIFSIISICSINLIKVNKSFMNNVSVDFFNNYMLQIIGNSALYCKEHNRSGYLLFKEDNKTIKFFCNNSKVDEYKLPKGFEFVSPEVFQRKIEIDNLGMVIKACTINYIDSKDNMNTITIRVGTRYVQIK